MAADFVELALSDPETVVASVADRRELLIGDVFIGLRNDVTPIQQHEFDTRSFNGLCRAGATTWSALATMTIGDLWNVPSMGSLSVERILAAAAERNIAAFLSSDTEFPQAVDTAAMEREQANRRLLELLQDTAARLAFDGRAETFGDLIDVLAGPGPIDLSEDDAVQQLRAMPLIEIVDPVAADGYANLPTAFIDSLGDDRAEIFVERCLRIDGRPTLEELGELLGVTRERVRQIESRLVARAESQCDDKIFAPLVERARWLARELGPVCAYEDERTHQVLADAAAGFKEPDLGNVRELLLWIAGPYQLHNGSLVRKGADPNALVNEFDRRFADSVLVEPDAVATFATAHRIPDTATLLAQLRGWRQLDDGRLARWRGGVADKAYLAFTVVGEPMLLEQLDEWIGETHSLSYLQNAMSKDSRFVRIDKENRFGLSQWGFEDYRGIAEMLRARIEREGSVVLDDVATEFAERFRVSENSVRAYAATPAFVTEDGKVRLRRDDEPLTVDARVRDDRGVYVDDRQRVIIHVPVDADVLRGSGRTFPAAAAMELGIGIGASERFVDPVSDIPVAGGWKADSVAGPTLGSLRLVAERLGAASGDMLRLRFDPSDGTYSAELADTSTLAGATGLEIRQGEEKSTVASAIRSKRGKVRKHLKARGDTAVAQLIPKD